MCIRDSAGGIPDLIDEGVTGFLVPPEGEEKTNAYVDRLNQLIEDPGKRAEMSKLARTEAERHSWRGATEKLVEFYHLAIDRHGSYKQALPE